nr:glutathione binding-like protein [Azospirillum picis]
MPVQRARAVRKFNGDANALPWIDAAAKSGLVQFNQDLVGRTFIEGDRLTIADIFAFPWIDLLDESGIDAADYPEIRAWAARMRAQPGFKPQYDLMPAADAEC